MRLHFNRIGYSLYGKEQSRRVPSLRAKPGNPGYGFRRARWRDTLENEDDRDRCRAVLREAGLQDDRIQTIQERVQEVSDVHARVSFDCTSTLFEYRHDDILIFRFNSVILHHWIDLQVRHEWDQVRRPSRPAGPGRPRRSDGDSKIKVEGGEEGSRSPCLDEPNAEPRQTSPGVVDTAGQGPSGACTDEKDNYSAATERRRDFLNQIPLPVLCLRENRDEGGDVCGKVLPPFSPALKRGRENDDIFSPSIYPRLTALKLISPNNTPKPSPAQLDCFRKYECSPLLNRAGGSAKGSPSEGPASRAQDPSLLLPPLALPISASGNTQVVLCPRFLVIPSQLLMRVCCTAQPAGGVEERSMTLSTFRDWQSSSGPVFKSFKITAVLEEMDAMHSVHNVECEKEQLTLNIESLSRGCQEMSALEFLADTAAAQCMIR